MKHTKKIKQLARMLARLETSEECLQVLTDLCTPAELRAMSERLDVAMRIAKGIPYRAISESTGVSTATITRVARSVTYGAGGYQKILTQEGDRS